MTITTPATTFVTGANKGIGFEVARQLIAAGHTVYVGARDRARGEAAAERLGAGFVHIDVADEQSVAAAVAGFTALDVLINNAGITHGRIDPAQVSGPMVEEVLQTNLLGPVRLVHGLLPLLRRSARPVVINVSSSLGSLTYNTDPARPEQTFPTLAYATSKAALNMATIQWARSLPEIRFHAVDPGYTATDMIAADGLGGGDSVEKGAQEIVRLAMTSSIDGPTGTFTDRRGQLPW